MGRRFSTIRASFGMGNAPAAPSAAAMLLVIVVTVMSLNMAFITRQNARDWHPYSEFTLRYDKLVAGWGNKVPAELRQTLARK